MIPPAVATVLGLTVALGITAAPVGAGVQDSKEQGTSAGGSQATPPPARVIPPDPSAVAAEWTTFSSREAGIELSVPPGQKQETSDAHVLWHAHDAQKNWRFEVRRLPLEQPMQLAPQQLPEGGRRPGLLELVALTQQQSTNGEILRQSITPLGQADAGTFVLRYTVPDGGTLLRQVAVIQAGGALYYQLSLTTPSPAGPIEALEQDDGVRAAVEAFNRSLNSFKVLDQTELRQEQEQRLFNTRTLFVNLTRARLLGALQEGEHYRRILRDGQDVGYSYLVEEPADEVPADPAKRQAAAQANARGVRVGIRTRLRRDGGWLDRETWLFTAADMKEEDFRERNQLIIDGERRAENIVVGMMRGRRVPVRARVERPDGLGAEVGVADVMDARRLEVTFVVNGQQAEQPLERQLPAWYVPLAVEHLLPRIAARWGQNQYLVAVYNPEKREIYQQYIDVEGLKTVELPGGQRTLVMAVQTRIGLSGAPTRHYIDPNTYQWLGSVSPDEKLEIWPTDAETLRSIWTTPELTAPDARQRDAPNQGS